MLQINLNRSREAQDLAIQTAREREVGILVILEQNRDLHNAMWFKDKRGYAAIYVCKDEHYRAREVISGNGYVDVAPRRPKRRGLRGDLLEEMVAAYNLVVTNRPNVPTFEKGIATSALNLMFASPEVTKTSHPGR